jgi:RNA polymerase sigma-70 factor (ECF subfamily)
MLIQGKCKRVPDKLEQETWIKFAQGDGEVWREFLGREIPKIYSLFMKSWPNPSLAEELVQKTVFDAVRGRGSYKPDRGTPEEWIFGIARNNIRLELRKRASREGINGDIRRYFETIDTKLLPDEVLEKQETAEIVRSALGKLESREEVVLRAMYIEALPVCDIARQMDITEKAVYNLLYRAKISLRQELKKKIFQNDLEQGPWKE